MSVKCQLCDKEADVIFRCKEHSRCDDCGATTDLFHGVNALRCRTCYNKWVQKQLEEFDGDTTHTDELQCPHCGYVHGDSWEVEGDNGTDQCHQCGLDYEYERVVSVSYCTIKPKKKESDDDITSGRTGGTAQPGAGAS